MDIANLRGLTGKTSAINELQDSLSRMGIVTRGLSDVMGVKAIKEAQDSISSVAREARELSQAMNLGLPDAIKALHASPFDNLLKQHKRMLGIANPFSEWSNSIASDFAQGLSPLSSRIAEQFALGVPNLSFSSLGINNTAAEALRSFQEQQDLYASHIREAMNFGGITQSVRTAIELLNDELSARNEINAYADLQETLHKVGNILEPISPEEAASEDTKTKRVLFLKTIPTGTLIFIIQFLIQYILPIYGMAYTVYAEHQNAIEREQDRRFAEETREINKAQHEHVLTVLQEMQEALKEKPLYRVIRDVPVMNEQQFNGVPLFQAQVGEVVEIVSFDGKWVLISGMDYENNIMRAGWVKKKYLRRLSKDEIETYEGFE